ncbi:hypothetical protein RV12_GL002451 [Enterococcus quebecensis]|nr:hypothetical protein RV12_GL002451 [Enterococcus quebecensis]
MILNIIIKSNNVFFGNILIKKHGFDYILFLFFRNYEVRVILVL